MNEFERKEFEHHKKLAEEQLNKMYFGTNKTTKNSGGISFPSFISTPDSSHNAKPNKKNSFATNKPKSETSKPDFLKKDFAPPKENNKKNNILNLLNFKGMKIDNDRLIILAVCLLLSGEDVDEILMLALLYIML